jgi:thiamine-phosphate pyrophosphorylase
VSRDRLARPDLRLIVITDARLAAPRTIEQVVESALEAGAPAIQLRDKDASAADLYHQAGCLLALTRRHDALLFINDRLDVALAAGTDGVHLGPHDLPIAAARTAARRAGRPDLIIGTSTDDPDRARLAQDDGADYIGCGAVFGTTSKRDIGDERIGTERLARVARAVDVPVVGIGGVTPANISDVARAGAAGAAVIAAVMTALDAGEAVRRLLEPFGEPPARPDRRQHSAG